MMTPALLQQALDALDTMTRHFGFSRLGNSTLADTTARATAHAAMKNLQAAIAQPVQPLPHGQKTEAEKIAFAAGMSCRPASVQVLAENHRGMRVDYSGLFKQARNGLSRDPVLAEMLRQLQDHLQELGKRWYAGDIAVVDEILQLYCIEGDARKGIAESQPAGAGGNMDVAGAPKTALSALESMALDACNRVKAWAESDRSTPFPEKAHMLADGVLMVAAQRRKGVQ